MDKKIIQKKFKMVRAYDPISMGGGSGLGIKVRKLYYVCACGKTVAATNWKKHTHG